MASFSRRLFIGGHMHGKVESIETGRDHWLTIDPLTEGLTSTGGLVMYSRKRFAADNCAIDVFAVGSATAGNILATLATLAGVDYEHLGE